MADYENDEEFDRLRRKQKPCPNQQTLFYMEPDWKEHWWSMPAFVQVDAQPAYQITVNFLTGDDIQDFADKLGLKLTTRSNSAWYPPEDIDGTGEWEYV